MSKANTKKMVIAAIFAGVSVVGSLFSIPIFGAKCAPVQHLMNIVSAILLGPGWAFAAAFVSSLVRNLLGLGTILAFPGSMCGALLAGILYKKTGFATGAYIGEVFGTSVIGGMLSYPIASLLLGNETAALFTFVFPFFVSTAGGAVMAMVIMTALQKTGVLKRMQRELTV